MLYERHWNISWAHYKLQPICRIHTLSNIRITANALTNWIAAAYAVSFHHFSENVSHSLVRLFFLSFFFCIINFLEVNARHHKTMSVFAVLCTDTFISKQAHILIFCFCKLETQNYVSYCPDRVSSRFPSAVRKIGRNRMGKGERKNGDWRVYER